MNCLSEAYALRGQNLDSLMQAFETDLLDAGLLEAPGADAYRGMLQQLASGLRLDFWTGPSFSQRSGTEGTPLEANEDCRDQAVTWIARHPDALMTRFLDRLQVLQAENTPADLQASALLDLLQPADLEDPFYRLMTYPLIALQASASAAAAAQPINNPTGMPPTPGANLMRLYLNERGQVVVADQLVPEEILKARIFEHARRFGAQARYLIEPEPDVKFRGFTRLKDQIARAVTEARDQFARRVLGKPLTELTPTETQWVALRFPMDISLP
ncbi:hypothetical protein OZ410_08715 [Robiginitalea sp. M366]|uniref:hypothetical protein n=1 Tax=Robiginitalea aestuariiviva TaxID=3036903 RepID=UPI00240E28C6|nr:hypothetical protein [Robiginitalea aestuariiviva]MDG1572396.1 hypothetical protein [Robiginitalea aestuariiviva]